MQPHEIEDEYQRGLDRAEAKEHKIIQETDYFMKYELTPGYIEEWLMQIPESLAREIHALLLNKEDRLIGAAIRSYLWKTKYQELDEFYDN